MTSIFHIILLTGAISCGADDQSDRKNTECSKNQNSKKYCKIVITNDQDAQVGTANLGPQKYEAHSSTDATKTLSTPQLQQGDADLWYNKNKETTHF